MTRIKVEDNFDLERDIDSNAVINNNKTAYAQRLEKISKKKMQADEIANIKTELAEIKALIKELGGK